MKEDKVYIYFHPLGIDVSIVPIPFIIGDEYIRKDALLEWLKMAVECYSHPDTVNVVDTIRCEGKKWAFQDVINKIESL